MGCVRMVLVPLNGFLKGCLLGGNKVYASLLHVVIYTYNPGDYPRKNTMGDSKRSFSSYSQVRLHFEPDGSRARVGCTVLKIHPNLIWTSLVEYRGIENKTPPP